jgi:hypothetical protein
VKCQLSALGLRLGVALALAAMPVGGTALSQELSLSGSVTSAMRYFTQSPAFPSQGNTRFAPSLRFEGRLAYEFAGGADRLVISPFYRLGASVEGRTHFDLREAYWLHQGDGWSLTAGIDKVFWGVTESRYLVDIINQNDLREDLIGEEKLGQPMVNLSFYTNWGSFGLYVLPVFRPRDYRDFGARLSGPLPIGDPVYTSPDGRNNVDYALRWAQSLGAWDLGVSYFRGTGREPKLVPGGPGLVPVYDQIRQAGLDLQFTGGAWLWKLEAIERSGQGPTFRAVTGGFEWTLSGLTGSGIDLGLIAELSYDGRDPSQAPLTFYDDDVFLGARMTFNDISDTSILAGVLIDRNTNAQIARIEGRTRLGEDWMLGVDGVVFSGATVPDPLAVISRDSYVEVSFRRSF